MSSQTAGPSSALGFLSVLEHPQHGLFGGYLLLNTAGRPLEFHCTAPIKPNRAQQILYGPTLEPFLYGEQIGRTLLAKATVEPVFVFTDCLPALAVRDHVCVPVAMVLPPGEPLQTEHDRRALRFDAAGQGGIAVTSFQLGRNRLALPGDAQEDRRLLAERLAEATESFDLAEPFTRIRDAIEEAQQAVRSG